MNTKSTKQELKPVLQRIRERVAKHWTQGTGARDDKNHPVFIRSPLACKWCLFGATVKECSDDQQSDVMFHIANNITELNEFSSELLVITKFNDTAGRTKEEVLAVVDKAIADCT